MGFRLMNMCDIRLIKLICVAQFNKCVYDAFNLKLNLTTL